VEFEHWSFLESWHAHAPGASAALNAAAIVALNVVTCGNGALPPAVAVRAIRIYSTHRQPLTAQNMQLAWLSLAVAATVAYHLVLKLTPAGVNPLLSLLVTYGIVALLFAGVLAIGPGNFDWRQELRLLNWTALGLAVTIIALDLGFILLYRSGYEVSLGALVTQSAAAMLLLATGVLVFREKLSLANGLGVLFCLAGLWLVNRR
jgi:drug/metabolite transporter (DMT)-like permease